MGFEEEDAVEQPTLLVCMIAGVFCVNVFALSMKLETDLSKRNKTITTVKSPCFPTC